jgi:hypothetical protein
MGRIDPKHPFSLDPHIDKPIVGREPEYIFVHEQDFNKALESTKRVVNRAEESQTQGSRENAPLEQQERESRAGRKSLKDRDAPIVELMRQLLVTKKALSAQDAAMKVAAKAEGGGTLESRADRLARRYRERYPSD